MARIKNTDRYVYDSLPTYDDYVIGTDAESGLRTKNYKIGDIAALVTGGGSFLTLTDTPISYVGQAGLVPVVNGTETGLEFAAAGGVSDFLTLTDTPALYTGQAGKVAAVNGAENALEFIAVASGTVTQGTWVPNFIDSGLGATYTINGTIRAYYARVGNLVMISADVANIRSTGTPTGSLQIDNMPYNAAGGFSLACSRFFGATGTGDFYSILPGSDNGGSTIMVFKFKDNSTHPNTDQSSSPIAFPTNGYVTFSGVYYTDDA